MKKIIVILLIFHVTSLFAQNPYYDALRLNNHSKIDRGTNMLLINLDTNNAKEMAEIFDRYGIIRTGVTGGQLSDDIKNMVMGNPFIGVGTEVQSGVLESTLVSANKTNSSINGIGGLNVTNVADGLAKFLVNRTKQELTITFFNKFKDKLNDSDELRLLFPNSTKTLNTIDEEIYMLSNYLNSLRDAFEKDLDNMLTSLEGYVNQTYKNDEYQYITEPFGAGLFFASQIKNGIHPAEALGNLSNRQANVSDYNTPNFRKFIYSLKVFDIFSESLRSKEEGQYWISSKELNLLFDETTFRIYIGLLYQQHKGVQLGEDAQDTFGNYVTNVDDLMNELRAPLISTINKSNQLQLIIKSISEKKVQGLKVDTYAELFSNSTALLKEGQKLASAIKITIPKDSIEKYIHAAELITNMYSDISEKKYSALIMDVISLSDTLNFIGTTFNKNVLKYGSFIANLAQAESSDQIEAAIEAIALPVGSASIKRKTVSNISLNAYLGISPGLEYNGQTGGWKGTFGINSPIGIAFSRGHFKEKSGCNCKKEKGSTTWFLSLIDIGAFSTFRFNDSETETLPEVKLSNIFAPGLYFVYGIPEYPISIGIGGQLGPQLREITAATIATSSELNFGFKLFIAMDIPLLNFHTKTRD